MRIGHFSSNQTDKPWCGAHTPNGDVVDLHVAGEEAGIEIPRQLSDLPEMWNWRESRLHP